MDNFPLPINMVVLLPNTDQSISCPECENLTFANWSGLGISTFYGKKTCLQYACSNHVEQILATFHIADNQMLEMANGLWDNNGVDE